MLIDGRAIAEELFAELKNEVAKLPKQPTLQVFSCEPTFETQKYLALKERKAAEVGIDLSVELFDGDASLQHILFSIREAQKTHDAIVVQLPFPKRFSFEDLATAIAPSHDADVMMYDGTDNDVLPPVVGAIAEMARRHSIPFKGQKVVVVGSGRLVGAPAALYLKNAGAQVSVVTEVTEARESLIKEADILVLGAGVPGLITPDMVKDDVVVFDAGTSEMNGALAGDAHPAVAEKASYFTPVPGGIGPITIAILLRNVVRLMK